MRCEECFFPSAKFVALAWRMAGESTGIELAVGMAMFEVKEAVVEYVAQCAADGQHVDLPGVVEEIRLTKAIVDDLVRKSGGAPPQEEIRLLKHRVHSVVESLSREAAIRRVTSPAETLTSSTGESIEFSLDVNSRVQGQRALSVRTTPRASPALGQHRTEILATGVPRHNKEKVGHTAAHDQAMRKPLTYAVWVAMCQKGSQLTGSKGGGGQNTATNDDDLVKVLATMANPDARPSEPATTRSSNSRTPRKFFFDAIIRAITKVMQGAAEPAAPGADSPAATAVPVVRVDIRLACNSSGSDAWIVAHAAAGSVPPFVDLERLFPAWTTPEASVVLAEEREVHAEIMSLLRRYHPAETLPDGFDEVEHIPGLRFYTRYLALAMWFASKHFPADELAGGVKLSKVFKALNESEDPDVQGALVRLRVWSKVLGPRERDAGHHSAKRRRKEKQKDDEEEKEDEDDIYDEEEDYEEEEEVDAEDEEDYLDADEEETEEREEKKGKMKKRSKVKGGKKEKKEKEKEKKSMTMKKEKERLVRTETKETDAKGRRGFQPPRPKLDGSKVARNRHAGHKRGSPTP